MERGASVEARCELELPPAAHARLWAVSAHLPMHAVFRARLYGAAVPKREREPAEGCDSPRADGGAHFS